MLITGVKTLILAAATAALPFTPPAGWVQLPQSAVGVHVNNMWAGPKLANGAQATFSAAAFPFPGSLQMLTTAGTKASQKTSILKTVSSTALTLCGTPARLLTQRVNAAGTSSLLQQEVAVKNGYAYMLMYTRPANTPAQPQIAQNMRAFCPSGTAKVPDMPMPSGWSKTAGQMELLGAWMGTQPGQVLTLMRATQMSTLDQLFASAQKQSLKNKSGKNLVKVTQHEQTTMCGYPGMLVGMQVNSPQLPVGMDMALTQGNGTAYVLTYIQMGSAASDPNAVASLRTLCVTVPAAASASPAPSASPAATPAPAATPTP